MAPPPPPHSISLEPLTQAWISPFVSARIRRKDANQTGTAGLDRRDAKDGKQAESHHNQLVEQDHRSSWDIEIRVPWLNRSSWAMPSPHTGFFILDSGATSHVVGDVSLFGDNVSLYSPSSWSSSSFFRPGAATYYQARDGRVLPVAGVGTVSWGNLFHIPDVLFVPDLRTGLNLVSVQQLAACDYLVMFGGGKCSAMDRATGKIVGKGRLHADDGLYHLDFLHIPHGGL